jgi:hypothetical protein
MIRYNDAVNVGRMSFFWTTVMATKKKRNKGRASAKGRPARARTDLCKNLLRCLGFDAETIGHAFCPALGLLHSGNVRRGGCLPTEGKVDLNAAMAELVKDLRPSGSEHELALA